MNTALKALSLSIALFLALWHPAGAAEKKPLKAYNGAIAYHRDSGSYGYAINRATARDAQVEALKQCAHERCEVVARLRNNCGSVANGSKRFTVGTGATRQESETKALRACGPGCDIVTWACTR